MNHGFASLVFFFNSRMYKQPIKTNSKLSPNCPSTRLRARKETWIQTNSYKGVKKY
ncbi:hypothetical protein HanRHA438_Chr05g0207661 [Helianthus annuus]|uniref:Uncharacterized protein n=1 Tax=Helianthus annuus TaxID=4232 RepID=A0A251ULS0_HELAN|nr:hypothetical protein HanXRQr2_Chr05g0198071 [Helianthus annuus]KAJ0917587.1 hypothetical protein HanRHA438_Chr05g0207661 [Helianthus annuus]KAJ0921404.1 hypothetical protein HanPSC8_Chr05g0191111 [Helianthus annuus]